MIEMSTSPASKVDAVIDRSLVSVTETSTIRAPRALVEGPGIALGAPQSNTIYLPSVKVSMDEQSTPNIATTSPAATESTSCIAEKTCQRRESAQPEK